MRIILDGMGGDYAPDAIVEGAVRSLPDLPKNWDICLVGKEDMLRKSLKAFGYTGDRISIENADEVITNDDAPVRAIRRKKQSSIVIGLNLVKAGKGDVFISAGSTGALLAGGLLILGRIRGIDRPTLATLYPVIGAEPSLLTDAGANAECKPRNLLEFGMMGSVYMEKVLDRPNPTVGLINNGSEEEKGTPLTKKARKYLAKSSLNFIGYIESRDLQTPAADVIVTDGFTGNALLKLTEGMGLMMLREIKKLFRSSAVSKLSALLVGKQLIAMKNQLDYREYGGAPILGLRSAVLKMHGSSDATAVYHTILKAVPYVEQDVVGIIENSVRSGGVKSVMETVDQEEKSEETSAHSLGNGK
ncbi:MAG: phosphate acyltransferase PlsX [Eubacteriales bacterium]|nr:phosphate acyltransferase PlsX [Eubacteriales bacterium]